MIFKLESDRLLLEVLTGKSADKVCNFYKRNHSFLKPWEPNLSSHFLSLAGISKILDYEMKNTLQGRSIRYWFSLKNEPMKVIGSINFQDIKRGAFKSCRVGYKIDSAFLRRGLTKEALKCALFSSIKNMNMHRFEAIIQTDNLPSIKLAESLGFVNEGISRSCVLIGNEWKDCYCYSLLENELT